jgi:ssDNA-binding Zn-finger/Zn-ribbon topoisomerase 1
MREEYCPKCVIGNKIERQGKYGFFIGCTRYPKCDYVEKSATGPNKGRLEMEADEILKKNGHADLII